MNSVFPLRVTFDESRALSLCSTSAAHLTSGLEPEPGPGRTLLQSECSCCLASPRLACGTATECTFCCESKRTIC